MSCQVGARTGSEQQNVSIQMAARSAVARDRGPSPSGAGYVSQYLSGAGYTQRKKRPNGDTGIRISQLSRISGFPELDWALVIRLHIWVLLSHNKHYANS